MNKEILRLAIPNIISNITVPLLGMVDVGLMGHLKHPSLFIGAVALGSVIFTILYWAFSFIRMGTSGITAQNFGQDNPHKCIMALARAIFIALVAAGILIIFQLPIEKICFWLLEGDANTETFTQKYYYIRIYSAPAVFSLYAFTGWFIGMQNSWIPMIISISVNIINIVVSYVLVYQLNLAVKGVAWGTLIAQYFGVCIAIIFLLAKYKKYLKYFTVKIFKEAKELKKFYTLNTHIFFRTLCLIFVFTFFTAKSAASDNTIILSTNMVLIQYLYLFSHFLDGFAYAGEAIIGKYCGMQEEKYLHIALRYLFRWGCGVSILFSAIYLLEDDFIIHILTSDSAIRLEATKFSIWLILLPLCSFASFIWDGIYIGVTAGKYMFITMLLATFVFFLPSYYILFPLIDNHALWIALLIFMLIRGISQTIIWKKFIKDNLF